MKLLLNLICQRPVACLVLAALMTGCASTPSVAPPTAASKAPAPQSQEVYDDRFYAAATSAGRQLWQIDAQASLITITVHRGGTLARLGHDHVLASRSVNGYVAPMENHAALTFRLDQLTVDEAALRQAAGFETQPSIEAIDGTRHNMLTRVLDTQRFPEVRIDASRLNADAAITTRITLNGVTCTQEVLVQIQENGAEMRVNGSMKIKQSDFGIVPFSVLNGAIAVQDELDLAFRLIAHPHP